MIRWEYKVATVSASYPNELSARLNRAAHPGDDSTEDGWEIFAVESGPRDVHLYMKRRLAAPLTASELADRARGKYYTAAKAG